jgi:signal transduction histidine kinase
MLPMDTNVQAFPDLRAHIEAIFDTIRDPLLLLDSELRVVAANRAFYDTYQVEPGGTVGCLLYELGSGQWNNPRLRVLLDEVLRESTTVEDFEVELAFEHIGHRIMLLNARTLYNPESQTEMILLAIEDATERIEADRELSLRNEEMEQFTHTVSHDLKSPLVTINGFIGMLEAHLAAGRQEKVPHAIERIRRAADRMSRLIDNLLELSRIGRVRGELVPVDVTELVRQVADTLKPRLARLGCTVEIEAGMPQVRADKDRLADVFENLLTNALKYGCASPGSKVSVGAERADRELRYFVRDEGPGIAQEYQERIFGLFQRLQSDQEGTGVGLAIVAKVMHVHGGQAWVESEPGKGATFWISFSGRADGSP